MIKLIKAKKKDSKIYLFFRETILDTIEEVIPITVDDTFHQPLQEKENHKVKQSTTEIKALTIAFSKPIP